MHELAVTENIVEACCERAGGRAVDRVTLEIGALTCVLPDSLRFCFEIATQGTPLEGAELEIIRNPARSRCSDCGGEVEMQSALARCDCGSMNLEQPRGGDSLRIRSMQLSARPQMAEVS